MNKNKKDNLGNCIDFLKERFGTDSIIRVGDTNYSIDTCSTGSISLDLALGVNGIPYGRIVEIFGPEGSGKTTLALHIIGNVQKSGKMALMIDAEHALDMSYAKKVGVEVENLYICQPTSGEEALDIADHCIKSNAFGVVVIDSVAALVPRNEINGNMGDYVLGSQARLMSQGLRKMLLSIHNSKCIVIFINQLREKVGVIYGCFKEDTHVKILDDKSIPINVLKKFSDNNDMNHSMNIKSLNLSSMLVEDDNILDVHNNGICNTFAALKYEDILDGSDKQLTLTAEHILYSYNVERFSLMEKKYSHLSKDDYLIQYYDHSKFLNMYIFNYLFVLHLLFKEEISFILDIPLFNHEYSDNISSVIRKITLNKDINVDINKISFYLNNRLIKITPLLLLFMLLQDRKNRESLEKYRYNDELILNLNRIPDNTILKLVSILNDNFQFTSIKKDKSIFIKSTYIYVLYRAYKKYLYADINISQISILPVRILDLYRLNEEVKSYRHDITVENNCNYFANSILVHNSSEITAGGKALKYYASIRLDIRRIAAIKDGDSIIGNRTRVRVVKNKVAAPSKEAEFDIIYSEGISKYYQLIDYAISYGIIKRKGAWFEYEGNNIAQGRTNLKALLVEDNELYEKLYKLISDMIYIKR